MNTCKYRFNLLLMAFLLSCTSSFSQKETYEVQVNSIGSPVKDSNKTYYLVLGDSVNSNITDIENARYIQLLTATLSEKGYTRIIDTLRNKFKYFLFFNFNISVPKEEEFTQYRPVYNQPNNNTTNVNVNVNSKSGTTTTSNSNITPYGAVFESNKSQTPTVSGYTPIKNTRVSFIRNMNLTCSEKGETQNRKLWFVDAKSVGSSDDLRLILPILLFVSKDYLEKDSKTRKTISVKSKDKELKKFLNADDK